VTDGSGLRTKDQWDGVPCCLRLIGRTRTALTDGPDCSRRTGLLEISLTGPDSGRHSNYFRSLRCGSYGPSGLYARENWITQKDRTRDEKRLTHRTRDEVRTAGGTERPIHSVPREGEQGSAKTTRRDGVGSPQDSKPKVLRVRPSFLLKFLKLPDLQFIPETAVKGGKKIAVLIDSRLKGPKGPCPKVKGCRTCGSPSYCLPRGPQFCPREQNRQIQGPGALDLEVLIDSRSHN